VKPVGPNVERAWKAVEESFEVVNHRDTSCEAGSKWAVLRLLKDEAIRTRQLCDADSSLTSAAMQDSPDLKTMNGEIAHTPNLTFVDGTNWDIHTSDFPDWSDLVDNLDSQDFGGANYSM